MQLRSVTKIGPKSPFLCEQKLYPIWVFVPGLMSSGVAFSSIHSGTSISRKAKGQEEFVHHNKVSLYRHSIPYILLIIIAIANKNKRATILPILFHLAGITIICRK